MIPKTKPFKLFACCFPVKGAGRSIICDVQRQEFEFVPNALFEVLQRYEAYTINQIISEIGKENEKYILEYFQFLYDKEYIFFCEKKEEINRFPKMSLTWEMPFHITNTIIDIDKNSELDFSKIVSQLEQLACPHIQIRFFDTIEWDKINEIASHFLGSCVNTIEIILPYHKHIIRDVMKGTCIQHKRLTLINLYNAPFHQVDNIGYTKVIYLEDNVTQASHCGIVQPQYFVANVEMFTESQHHNTCLNRKISIDTKGNIKNCPSMQQSFGNIKDTTLKEALNHSSFKKYWNITKDQISVCQDCEFRHICTDCRAYIENPSDIYSKPLKCGYNPYTCEWEAWSANSLKTKAIQHYELTELVTN